MSSLISQILQEDENQCVYELLKKSANVCTFVKSHCGEEVESFNLFKMRYCLLGGEGEGGAILFFVVLVSDPKSGLI